MATPNESRLCLRAPQPYLGELADSWPGLRARVHEMVGLNIPEAWLESLEGHYEILWKGTRLARAPWSHHWLEPVALSLAGNAHRMLSLEETRLLVEKAKSDSRALKEALEETDLSLIILHAILHGLLKEMISVADIEAILTIVVTHARFTRDAGSLIERVRSSMAPWITQRFERAPGELDVILLSPEVSQALDTGARLVGEGLFLEIPGELSAKTLGAIERCHRAFGSTASSICLLVDPPLRPVVAKLCERALPQLAVLSWNEVHLGTHHEVHATVTF